MDIITLNYTGTVAPVTNVFGHIYGIDGGGYFVAPGGSLAGLDFAVTWTGYDCNCRASDGFNPIISATLTINDHSFTYGPGTGFGNIFGDTFQQVQSSPPGGTFLATGSTGDHFGSFSITPCCDSRNNTYGYLNVTVPAPVMGSELAGLIW